VRRWLAQGKDVTLLGATAPVWVEGSPEMLGRAILNLAENAINHTAAESTVEFMVEDNGTVSVLDYGLGIAGNERNLISQRFWRRGHRKGGSTGLGLSRHQSEGRRVGNLSLQGGVALNSKFLFGVAR